MAITTKVRKRGPDPNRRVRAPAPDPADIYGHDAKRIAVCTSADNHRWALNYVELSPLGLTATDGKMLCLVNAPGWPYHCLLEPKDLKNVPHDAKLAINGTVQFVRRQPGCGDTTIAVPHEDPNEVPYPKWHCALPEAGNLQPMATVNITLLRKLLAALQRTPESSITIYANPDNCLAPALFANENGDLGLLMPKGVAENDEPHCHFPAALYQALGREAATLPPVFISPALPAPASPSPDHPAASSGLLG